MRLHLNKRPPALLRFGAFEIDSRGLELRRSGRPVRLAPQPAKALVYLASRAGEIVTKEELATHLWGAEAFVDSEAGLHATVKQIRQALGDSSRGPRFVETLPRRGYRFVAPVGRPSRSRLAWLGAAAAALIVAGIAFAFFRPAADPGIAPAGAPVAVDAYFKGRYILAQNQPDSGSRAAPMFERALELDPRSVPALLGLAESRLRMVGEGLVDRHAALTLAATTADRVLELDGDSGGGLALRARARWFLDWDWEGARRDFDRAAELEPDDARLRQSRAFFFSALGRHDAALEEIDRARALAPTSPGVNLDVAWLYFFARRYEEAIAEGLKALELAPGFFGAHYCLAESYHALGRRAESLEHAVAMTGAAGAEREALERLDPPARRAGLAAWWTADDRPATATIPAYDRAILALRAERFGEAFEHLRASARGLEWGITMAAVDPRLAPLHGESEFERLLASIHRGLPAGAGDAGANGRLSAL